MAADGFRVWEQAAPAALDVWREGEQVVIGLFGEHDLGTDTELSETLERFCGVGGVGDVIVDLSEVSFMDSSTIAALLGGRNLMLRQGRHLILRAPSPQALHVLELCGLVVLFDPMTVRAEPGPRSGSTSMAVDEVAVLRETRANHARPQASPGQL